MKIKVFEPNRYGKIEFTRAELEKLLNEVYTDGYKEGEYDARSHSWTWTSPYLTTDPAITLTSTNCAADKIKTVSDDSVATVCDKTSKNTDAKAYTVKVNGSISNADLSKLVSNIFAADAPRGASKKVENAFDKLAKELSF